jgi:uncharacterized lipoprotein YajG
MAQRELKVIIDEFGVDVHPQLGDYSWAYAAAMRIRAKIDRGNLVKVVVFRNIPDA